MAKNKRRKATSPAQQQSAPSRITQIVAAMQQWSGPMPHPDDLAAYDRILPGAADRILTMAEEQASHRRDLERTVVTSGVEQAKRGQQYGLVIAVVGLLVSLWMVALGADVTATVIGGSTLASLVGLFVYRNRRDERERQERWRQATGQ